VWERFPSSPGEGSVKEAVLSVQIFYKLATMKCFVHFLHVPPVTPWLCQGRAVVPSKLILVFFAGHLFTKELFKTAQRPRSTMPKSMPKAMRGQRGQLRFTGRGSRQ